MSDSPNPEPRPLVQAPWGWVLARFLTAPVFGAGTTAAVILWIGASLADNWVMPAFAAVWYTVIFEWLRAACRADRLWSILLVGAISPYLATACSCIGLLVVFVPLYYWWVVAPAGMLCGLTTYLLDRRLEYFQRSVSDGVCVICGYDLQGHPGRGAVCPECGHGQQILQ